MSSARLIRILDIVGAGIALLLLAVPMGLIALLVWSEDRGPMLFRQQRVGQGGQTFTILKFRTMRVARDSSQRSSEAGAPTATDRARFQTTVPGDPRITRVGAQLRRTHLDELPQLLNVLSGDMSLVGVRPDTPVQEVDYPADFWIARHRLRPGITGPAQLKSDTTDLAERTRLELEWLNEPTLSQYFKVLVGTVRKTAKRSGL